MEFKSKEEFAEWLGNVLSDALDSEDVYAEFGAYGRCELITELKDGKEIRLNIDMRDSEGNDL